MTNRLSDTLLALLRNPETPDYVFRDVVIEHIHDGAKMASVYVVSGETGEYSDRRNWPVVAFLEKAQAEAFCERLNAWCKENFCWYFSSDHYNRPTLCPLDLNFSCDYTGTAYHMWEIPLRAEG